MKIKKSTLLQLHNLAFNNLVNFLGFMILISYLNDRFFKVIVDLITIVKIAAVMAQKEFLMKILFRNNS